MASWENAPIVGGVSWKDAPIVGGPEQSATPKLDVIATTKDGGQVYRMDGGQLGFKSPGYATTDQARVQEIMKGAEPVDLMQRDLDQERIAKNPVASRALKAVEGVPFIGSYADEAVGLVSPAARDNMRGASAAMDRQNPGQSAALGIAGGIAGSVPMALAAGPAIVARAAPTIGARAIQGAALGATGGAIEGAIYGAGKGEGAERAGNAAEGAIIGGGAGAVLGAAAPYAAEGIKKALTSLKGSDVKAIQTSLSISPQAARVIKQALDVGDMREAEAALARAGDGAMLADAGQPARELLDAAANAGGRAGKIARDAVDTRANVASAEMQQTLDNFLGAPQGAETAKSGIRSGTQAARKTAYDAAYSQPIDYSSGRGRALEQTMGRIPKSAIKRANELMRLEGMESAQIMATIADNGRVTYQKMPDVRQLDYITRALNDVADQADGKGKLGGTTAVGRATKGLSTQIRTLLKGAVPEYKTALDTAADAISQTKATDLGYEMLRGGTKREAVREGLAGASKAERDAAKQGLRSYIDDTLANVSRTLTDPNTDAREGIKLIRDMSSRASMDKMRALLGPKAAKQLGEELDKQAVAFELRSAIATNSKTAIRQGIQNTVSDQTSGGVLETLASGEPVNASKRFVQIFTGNTAEAQALRQSGLYEEIATALTNTRGAKARNALKMVEKAMSGQQVTEQQAAFIGNILATSGFLAGGREASRQLSTQ